MTASVDFYRGKVIIIGGSIAGLMAGNVLHRMGWDVQIFERVADDLEGRGAGITILPGLIEGFRAAGVEATEERRSPPPAAASRPARRTRRLSR